MAIELVLHIECLEWSLQPEGATGVHCAMRLLVVGTERAADAPSIQIEQQRPVEVGVCAGTVRESR